MKPLPSPRVSQRLSVRCVILLLGMLLCLTADLAQAETKHSLIVADSSKNRIAIIDEAGNVAWETEIGPLHDLHVLENGHILFQKNWTHLVEVDPETDKVVWEYDSSTTSVEDSAPGQKVEVHAFQRLASGNTMVVESGRSRIIEVDQKGRIVHQVDLRVSKPHPHKDTRLVRKLENGNYLVCHEGDGIVREYDATGATVWEFAIPLFGRERAKGHGLDAFGTDCFSALRLDNGNTLIATGNGHSVIEVTPEKEIVWKLEQKELPGIELAWVTTLQELPNGNLVIGNCHAGPENPQVIEITREKEVVWKFHDFERFGNATTNSQILTTNGKPVAAKLGSSR